MVIAAAVLPSLCFRLSCLVVHAVNLRINYMPCNFCDLFSADSKGVTTKQGAGAPIFQEARSASSSGMYLWYPIYPGTAAEFANAANFL